MTTKTELINRILVYSYQISKFAPIMKPFTRWTIDAMSMINNFENSTANKHAWDFDYALQKILLCILKKNATDKEIAEYCMDRYKENLSQLYLRKKSELDRIKKKEIQYIPASGNRDQFIYKRFKPGTHLLYIGCGSGTECLRYASKGYCVTGIDIDQNLVDIANQYSQYLDLPFKAVCMDVIDMKFPDHSFDGF